MSNKANENEKNLHSHIRELQKLVDDEKYLRLINEIDLRLLEKFGGKSFREFYKYKDSSQSQLRQDLFALFVTKFKRNGYFIEIGATDGLINSNTFLLESKFQWKGVLIEPARIWHDRILHNRPFTKIVTKCIWSKSDEILDFNETENPELSTINQFSSSDLWAKNRENGKSYKVHSLSLNDLMEISNVPRRIDYLSIDTEGSEFDILEAFDFRKYKIKIITCEHNFTDNRDKIKELLESNGFERVFNDLPIVDDWYVNRRNSCKI